MKATARSLLVLDHHATAAEDLAGLDFCIFDAEESGASLTHKHFHPGEPLPALVRYVRDRDLWRFELPHSRAVHAWLRSHDFDLDFWDDVEATLENSHLRDRAISEGIGILRAQAKQVAAHVARGQPITLAGVPFLVCNCSLSSIRSEVAGALAKKTGAGAIWQVVPDGYLWNLRSDDRVDVSQVARIFGGGGHVRAAGFKVDLSAHHELLLSTLEP